jgi:2-methylaconitate cis-trans-isomerase PrpF
VDDLEVPGVGTFKVTMINSGIPTIFLHAEALGYTGTELQDDINGDAAALARFETIRAHGTLRVGAQAQQIDGEWTVTKVIMSRSARVLMKGRVHIPPTGF